MRYTIAVLIVLLAGCSASHTAYPAGGLPGAPSFTSQDVLGEGPAVSGSAITYYNIGSDPNTDNGALDVFDGLDGNIYYATEGPVSCHSGYCFATQGAYGQLNPVSKAFTEIPVSGSPQSVYVSPDGAVWGAINNMFVGSIGSLVRFSPFTAGGMTQIPLPPGGVNPSPQPREVTYNPSDQNIYFTDKFGSRVGKLPAAGPYNTGAMTMYSVPNGPPPNTPGVQARPNGITSAPNGNVFFADMANGVVYKLTFGGMLTGYVTPEQIALGSSNTTGVSYVRVASDGRIYLTQYFSPSFDAMSQSGAFTKLPTAPNAVPFALRTGFGLVVWNDYGNAAIGMYTISTGALREIPAAPLVGPTLHYVNGVVPTSKTSVWFACYGPPPAGKALCIGHLQLKSKWTVFPATTLTLKKGRNATNQLIGIAETGNSGPFSVMAADPSLVSVSTVANMDHNFILRPTGTITGTTTVTVLDAHGVSTPITVTVR